MLLSNSIVYVFYWRMFTTLAAASNTLKNSRVLFSMATPILLTSLRRHLRKLEKTSRRNKKNARTSVIAARSGSGQNPAAKNLPNPIRTCCIQSEPKKITPEPAQMSKNPVAGTIDLGNGKDLELTDKRLNGDVGREIGLFCSMIKVRKKPVHCLKCYLLFILPPSSK